MRVLMIGGTGFLGYFTCRDLVSRGHDVIALGLGSPPPDVRSMRREPRVDAIHVVSLRNSSVRFSPTVRLAF